MTLLGILFSQKINMFANKQTLKKKILSIERRPNDLRRILQEDTDRNGTFVQ